MRRILIMFAASMLCVMASQAQTWDSLYDAAKGIERSWKSKSLKVGNAYPQAKVHNFAYAFCSAYPQYKPCANLLKYLKNIAAYNPYKDEYSINDAPRNGFINSDMGYQVEVCLEVCYWKRTNGHSLVGVLIRVGHEAEDSPTYCLPMFYDYNPSKGIMTPDVAVANTVQQLGGKLKGNSDVFLPKEGKDIQVMTTTYYGPEVDDFKYKERLLKWTGNSFR